jgi:hypothetical protein
MGQDRGYRPFHAALRKLIHHPETMLRRNPALAPSIQARGQWVCDIEVDEREAPSEPRPGYPLGRERLLATHLANAPSRGALWARLCLEYGVRQDFLDWQVFT